jgi:hypothetical protein
MKQEIAEDEKVSKSRPVLLTQQEIKALLKLRNKELTEEGRNAHM